MRTLAHYRLLATETFDNHHGDCVTLKYNDIQAI